MTSTTDHTLSLTAETRAAGDIILNCAEPGAWQFSLSAESGDVETLRIVLDAPEEAFDALTEAAARLGTQCRKTEQQLAEQMHPRTAALPDWDACDLTARKTAARALLLGVFADGETLHAFLR